jgi:YcxB-like protein
MAPLAPVSTDEFRLTEQEFARGLRRLARRNRSLWVVALASPLLLVIGLVTGSAFLIVLGVALLISLAFTWFANPRMQWRRNPRRGDSQQFTFEEDRILVVTSTTRGEIAWEYYADIVETEDVYLLVGANKLCNILPRRVFASAPDEERFRLLVARHRDGAER